MVAIGAGTFKDPIFAVLVHDWIHVPHAELHIASLVSDILCFDILFTLVLSWNSSLKTILFISNSSEGIMEV